MIINLIANSEGIEIELFRQFIDQLLQSKAALGMPRRPHCRCRPSVDEYVVLFGEHVFTFVHILRGPSSSRTCAHPGSPIADQMQRSERSIALGASLQVNACIGTISH